MDIQQLRYFLKTAELLNYTRAAEAMYISRQSLRQAVAAMEEEIGKPLFRNTHNRLSLTEYGAYLFSAGAEAVASFDRMREGLNSLLSRNAALHLVFSRSLFPFILPETDGILCAFRAQFPDVALTVEQAENDEAIRAAESGEVDAACILQMPSEHALCRFYRLHSFDVAVSYTDPELFQGRTEIDARDLVGHDCIGMGSLQKTMRPLWETCLAENLNLRYQAVPSAIDAFYLISHEPILCFNIHIPALPEQHVETPQELHSSRLRGYTFEVGFLQSEHCSNPALLTLFCRFLDQEYQRLFAQRRPDA